MVHFMKFTDDDMWFHHHPNVERTVEVNSNNNF